MKEKTKKEEKVEKQYSWGKEGAFEVEDERLKKQEELSKLADRMEQKIGEIFDKEGIDIKDGYAILANFCHKIESKYPDLGMARALTELFLNLKEGR